jgi:tRNA dimethylallyltransferase
LKNSLVVIAGPTAVGKTTASISIAQILDCEIVSADSRQFYREMNIGTAKPSSEELNSVKHHFINNLSLNDEYNAGKFESEAVALIENKLKSNDYIILTGGSGLYVNAVLKGLDILPEADVQLRESLAREMDKKGIEFLQEELKKYDPEYYAEVDIQNPQRLIRALEVCILTGLPYSSFRNKKVVKRNFNTVKICLHLEREELYERINKRVDEMISIGLVDEVKSLAEEVPPVTEPGRSVRGYNALQTVGYNEMILFLKGEITFEKAIELIKRNTRRYAKRQLTWFRRDKEYRWFRPYEIYEMISYIRSC